MANVSSIIILLLTLSLFAYSKGTISSNSSSDGAVSSNVSQFTDIIRSNTTVILPSLLKNECKVVVDKMSAYTFQQVLKKHRPHFVQFHIVIQNAKVNKTKDVFQPGRWYWTFGLMSKPYQIPLWKLRYDIYSFGLLDFKTALAPRVVMTVHGKCNLTLGTEETSELITDALSPLVNIDSASNLPQEYLENYFCYLSIDENIRDTLAYQASIYFLFPIIYIDYKCCLLKYNFRDEKFDNNCSKDIRHIRWTHLTTINIILFSLIMAFFPIPLFKLLAWLGEKDGTKEIPMNDVDQEEWIYANGGHPLIFFDVMSFHWIGIDKQWPVLVSRIRRFFCLILIPLIIYIELYMNTDGIGVWKKGDKITIKDFVDVGAPVGFLALLGDASNRHKVFVPALGGPVGITALYFVLGFFFFVLPKCLKNVVHNGLPLSDMFCENLSVNNVEERQQCLSCRVIKSPLLFGANDIINLSQINVDPADLKPGYKKGGTLMRCNFYMLFSMKFWRLVWRIQITRARFICDRMPMLLCLLSVVCIPLYIVICLLEILMCLLYFGVPFLFFFIIMIRAGMKMIPDLRKKYTIFSYLFSFCFTRCLYNFVLSISILVFAYCCSLLFVSSFTFVTKVILYCFVAVVIFPSVSFGNIFLFVVIVYYIIRQLKLFKYNYTSLLLSAVTISKRINKTQNYVTCFNAHLTVSNVMFNELRGIEINGQLLDTSQNTIIPNTSENVIEMKIEEHSYGIPNELFQLLIRKYRPIHKHVLSMLLRVSILTSWLLLFLIITHNYSLVPDDQITEVLQVILIIAVGALPKLIESNHIGHSNAPKDKIEKKFMEQTIIEYWTKRKAS
ncbi:uncharacterized protein LOC132719280 [Ruditapes philippinarum]|uniref:uncharacterized protein LOC132719280 n=1 Tax=Ruditapes philippinarum TaxID=129788 RepID=UPI00295C24CE|nr:uncharacterized protein LOC132719280 [Ruditapes philippinarum]